MLGLARPPSTIVKFNTRKLPDLHSRAATTSKKLDLQSSENINAAVFGFACPYTLYMLQHIL